MGEEPNILEVWPPEVQEALDALPTERQRRFVVHYCTTANLCGYRAVELAGYGCSTRASAYTVASQLLSQLKVSRAVASLTKHQAMGADEVLRRLAMQAAADMLLMLDADGEMDLETVREMGLGHLIKEYEREEKPDGTIKTKVKLHDAQGALDKLAKAHGLYRASDDDGEGDRLTIQGVADLVTRLYGRRPDQGPKIPKAGDGQ